MWTDHLEKSEKRLALTQNLPCFFRCILQLTHGNQIIIFSVYAGIFFFARQLFCRLNRRNTKCNHPLPRHHFPFFLLTVEKRKIIRPILIPIIPGLNSIFLGVRYFLIVAKVAGCNCFHASFDTLLTLVILNKFPVCKTVWIRNAFLYVVTT